MKKLKETPPEKIPGILEKLYKSNQKDLKQMRDSVQNCSADMVSEAAVAVHNIEMMEAISKDYIGEAGRTEDDHNKIVKQVEELSEELDDTIEDFILNCSCAHRVFTIGKKLTPEDIAKM